jgi:hypothetical protein
VFVPKIIEYYLKLENVARCDVEFAVKTVLCSLSGLRQVLKADCLNTENTHEEGQ